MTGETECEDYCPICKTYRTHKYQIETGLLVCLKCGNRKIYRG